MSSMSSCLTATRPYYLSPEICQGWCPGGTRDPQGRAGDGEITDVSDIPSGKRLHFAIENGPVEIVDLPMNSMVIFHIVFCMFTKGYLTCLSPCHHSEAKTMPGVQTFGVWAAFSMRCAPGAMENPPSSFGW